MSERRFSERLKTAMKEAGVQSRQLAEQTGIDETNISHMLAGQRKPGVDNLAKLLTALPNVDARWLVTGERES